VKLHLKNLLQNLKSGIFQTAKAIPGFSHKAYKIRLGDKQRGKRGGFRVIYFKLDENKKIFLLSIFAKSDKENITNSELILILKRVKF
ncbi:MAG TPA: type II toxin-antitoxin system RelE/ParE family toxin, partial [Ignavibacteria bacterium]|nr:type II toxin-antitoxin system RelE/ParE family toxin [Ignavibacteria bacterium]